MTQKKKPAVEPKPAAKPAKPASTKADKTAEVKAAEDKTAEDKTAEDKAAEAKAAEKKATEAMTDEEIAAEKKATEAKAAKGQSANHKRAAEVFEMYPDLKECYFTSDGTAFTLEQHARMHGESQENSAVITIKKSEV